jgi:hypothetical protein
MSAVRRAFGRFVSYTGHSRRYRKVSGLEETFAVSAQMAVARTLPPFDGLPESLLHCKEGQRLEPLCRIRTKQESLIGFDEECLSIPVKFRRLERIANSVF